MPSVEDLLRKVIKEGRFHGLTLWPGPNGYQSSLKNSYGGWECHTHKDPIAALRAALGDTPPPAVSEGGVFD